MHSLLPSLLLAALASTAAGLPGFNADLNIRQDTPSSIPLPSGSIFSTMGSGTAIGTGAHRKSQHHHHRPTGTGFHHPNGTGVHHPTGTGHLHPTGTGGDHLSAPHSLGARHHARTVAPSITSSFPRPTGNASLSHGAGSGTGFLHPTTGGVFPTGHTRNHTHFHPTTGIFPTGGHKGNHSHTGSGFPHPTHGSLAGPSSGFPSPSGTGAVKRDENHLDARALLPRKDKSKLLYSLEKSSGALRSNHVSHMH